MRSFKISILVLSFFILTVGLSNAYAGPIADKLSEADLAKVKAGGVVAKNNISKDGSSGVSYAYCLIKGTPEDFWKTIWDYNHYLDFYPRLKKITVLSLSQNKSDVEFQMDVTIKTLVYTNLSTISADRRRLDWTLNMNKPHDFFKKNNGHWILEDLEPGVMLVEYQADILLDLGMFTSMATKIVNIMAKDDLPDMMISTKKRVESGNTWKRAK